MRLSNILLFLFFSIVSLHAQRGVQSPDDFFPYELGEHFIPHHLIVDYFEHLADNSDIIQLEEYGRTNQRRPLMLAYISSKENLAKLDQIKRNNLIRTGLIDGKIEEEEPIAIVWLGFGVHGNEAGATNSAIASVYELVSPTNTTTKEWLKNTVVILDPSLNPDGYSRYTHWNHNVGHATPNPHPDSKEHHEPWPGGRVNHYLFDLNRDWAWASQVETQARLKKYHEWMPHINVDVHEQYPNSPYYFAPAAQPYHTYITKWQADFQTEIGLNHTRYFDQEGWLYFTREVFDLFYPSYGDTYPTFNGAIGMTYEQAGHSPAGRAILINNGDTLTLTDRIVHHKTAILSTVEMGSQHAARINDNFEKYFNDSKSGNIGTYKTYIIKASNGRNKLKELTSFLDQHNIEYGSVKSGSSVSAFDYQTGKTRSVNVDEKDLAISIHQPMSILAQVLFDPQAELVDSLTYDITAWSLPYAHGLETYATTQRLSVDEDYKLPTYTEVRTDKVPYAFLAEWNSLNDTRFLSALLQKGLVVRSATTDFVQAAKTYKAGTLIILRIDNQKKFGDQFTSTVQKIAREFEQPLGFATTGFVTSGHDFGSSAVKILKRPNVLVVSGDGVGANAFGQVWHYFEQEIDFPVAVVNADRLSRTDLDEYSVLIMPSGSYWTLKGDALDGVKEWVQDGGKLIAIGGAINKLKSDKGFAAKRKEGQKPAPKLPYVGCYASQERDGISNYIPGAVYKNAVDNTHPLGFGLPEYYFSLKTSGSAYNYFDNAWNVGFVEDDPMVIGFVGSQLKPQLEKTMTFGVQNMGGGKVVYFVDNPLYRAFWKQGQFLFGNALFMVN